MVSIAAGEDSMDEKMVAVVTGGMGGLGTSICRKLAGDGFRVLTTYSPGNTHVQEWLAAEERDHFQFTAYQVDVSDYASCVTGVSKMLADAGRIDVLINNAGITRDASLKKMQPEDWQMVLRTNLDSVFNMSKQVLNGMLERDWGRIINISSVNGQKGSFGQTNYAAAKAGLHGFTKSLALEVASKGITVNTISPGYLRTQMVMKVPAEVLETKILPTIPAGRLGEPDEIAALVAYLASREAGFVNGANFSINGGQHMY
jgi:acetoacetyl-CoA reductase